MPLTQDEPEQPDPEIEEVEDDPAPDEWDPNFSIGDLARSLPQHVRVDSRRWLVTPERYLYRPLRALAASRAADELTAGPAGRALLGLSRRLRTQREALVSLLAEHAVDADMLEAEVDRRMSDYAAEGLEGMLAEAPGFRVFDWALGWLSACDVRRVPLPSRLGQDTGGLVTSAKGPSSWDVYYEGRQVHLLRLAAACCWGSLGPFFFDLRTAR